MNNAFDKLRELWVGLTGRQRFQLGLAIATTLLLVWGLSVYATRVRYGVLYSRLEPDDAGAVVAELAERQVPYRLSAGGTMIEVPLERVDEMRLALAGDGMPPGGGVGFEIFDKPAFGLSDFVQNVNYRRALERELGRTIQNLDAVRSARVHLALPPESVFAGEKRDPSASVVVRLRTGGMLASGQVRAISHLVASGVEGLEPSNVSVIDGEGRMLTDAGEADEQTLSATQLEAKRAMERGIESTLVSILEPIVGTGRVRARATVELNMTRVQRVEETFDPNVALVRSEQKTKSKSGGGGPGGIPGTASNLPGTEGGATTSAGSREESQSSMTNFELNKTTATIAEPVGTLTRQSVAVVVDHALAPPADGAAGAERVPAQRSPEEMTKITDIVRAAIGIDEQRGDVLIVENVPFDETAAPGVEAGGGINWGFWLRVARYAALPLAVLLLALLVIRPAIAAIRGLGSREEGATGPPTVAQLQARLQADLARGALPVLADGVSPLRRKLIEAAQEDPRAAAMVVKSWLEHHRDRD